MGAKRLSSPIIHSSAPVRICDNGGWTDTWFAHYGTIFNIAVTPGVEVRVEVIPGGEPGTWLEVEDYGQRYFYRSGMGWGRHPLLEAAIELMKLPPALSLEVRIGSKVPPGAGTGTSAAVTVALLGALDALTPGRMSAHELAYAAWRVETELLGGQSGIQDQLASAYGGINLIEMHAYPYASVSPIQVPYTAWWELERRLALIYMGKSHQSSQTHEIVIRGLEEAGAVSPHLQELRRTAPRSRDALYAGDFTALGQAMIDNHEAQRRLHPDLISTEADRIVEIARAHGAIGWKVNGAGGDGGSLTLLCDARSNAKRAMISEIETENSRYKNIPICLSRNGLRVWNDTRNRNSR